MYPGIEFSFGGEDNLVSVLSSWNHLLRGVLLSWCLCVCMESIVKCLFCCHDTIFTGSTFSFYEVIFPGITASFLGKSKVCLFLMILLWFVCKCLVYCFVVISSTSFFEGQCCICSFTIIPFQACKIMQLEGAYINIGSNSNLFLEMHMSVWNYRFIQVYICLWLYTYVWILRSVCICASL